MANIKSQLQQHDEAINLTKKAKDIEAQVTSKHSPVYQSLLQIEKTFETLKAQDKNVVVQIE